MRAIEAHELSKTYPGNVQALKGIDFAVQRGEVFGLPGPNGAGKSTTVGIFTTTISPTGGSAILGGHDVATQPLLARGISSVVFQEAVVDWSLTGRRTSNCTPISGGLRRCKLGGGSPSWPARSACPS